MADAEQELLEEILSYCKDVTGVDDTIFISSKGNTRYRNAAPAVAASMKQVRVWSKFHLTRYGLQASI